MTNELNIAYKLYALDANEDGIRQAAQERFARITPFYILVYCKDGTAPKGGIEMTQTETHRLSSQDEQWLLDCNIAILAEETKRNEAEIGKRIKEKMQKVEELLKSES